MPGADRAQCIFPLPVDGQGLKMQQRESASAKGTHSQVAGRGGCSSPYVWNQVSSILKLCSCNSLKAAQPSSPYLLSKVVADPHRHHANHSQAREVHSFLILLNVLMGCPCLMALSVYLLVLGVSIVIYQKHVLVSSWPKTCSIPWKKTC